MENPLVSVVMCTYNTGKYIATSIESVLNQTYKNFEFIIWDDGSTDNTKTIVESFKDDRIRYYYHENTGLGMALRLACEQAKGKYIARMDSDDVCLPTRFTVEVDFLERNKDYVLVSSAVIYIDDEGNYLGRTFPCSSDKVLKAILKETSMIVHPMVMMRRDAYLASGGYVPINYLEDGLFWNILGRQGKFYNISRPLGKYRLLEGSLGHSRNKYDEVFKAFRLKMANDNFILDSDIEFYNNFFIYSKNFRKAHVLERKAGERTLQEQFFKILKRIIGEFNAEKFIIWIKNNYYKLKLHA